MLSTLFLRIELVSMLGGLLGGNAIFELMLLLMVVGLSPRGHLHSNWMISTSPVMGPK